MERKISAKIQLATVMFTLAVSIMVFQNCSKPALSEADSKALSLEPVNLSSIDAESLMAVFAASGAKSTSSKVANETVVTYEAETVSCGSYYATRSTANCIVEQKATGATGTKEFKTQDGESEHVRNYFAAIGASPACAPADCPTVAESYQVTSVKCTRIAATPQRSTCTVSR